MQKNDIACMKRVADAVQLAAHIFNGNFISRFLVAHVQHHTGAEAPFQGNLVYSFGRLSLTSGGVVPGRVHMGARVTAAANAVRGQGHAIWKGLRFHPRQLA